jgi:pimeloyl-ACP methyl ester carboxylesterase
MCAASPSCGSIDEIMLVGYSQGGLDAQNLALWNALGGLTGQENRVPVTTVVTFGTPITSAGITPGVTTLNIQDQLDEVVDGVNVITSKIPVPWQVKLILAARAVAADLRGETYSARGDVAIGVHFNPETYRYLAHQFDNTPSDQFADQKRNINQFLNGQLIDPSEPNDPGTLSGGGGGNGDIA